MTLHLSAETWEAVAQRIARAQPPIALSWFAMRDHAGTWHLQCATLRSGCATAPRLHEYPHALLGAEALTPRQAAVRFASGELVAGSGRWPEDPPPQLAPSALWLTTEPGPFPYPPREWPRYYLNVRPSAPHVSGPYSPHDELVAPGLPLYASGLAAVAEVLFGVRPEALGSDLRSGLTVVLPDPRARLGRVGFAGGQTRVPVDEGSEGAVAGMTLRTAWRLEDNSAEWERADVLLSGPGTVDVSTAKIPAEMRVLLCAQDGQVLDRRYWTSDHGERPRPPVGPEDEAARIRRLVQEGEGPRVELKVSLASASARRSFAETVAAFANSTGGTVLIGVKDRSREIVGYGPESVRVEQQIAEVIQQLVDGAPDFDTRAVPLPEGTIYAVEVPEQSDRGPFVCAGRVLVRVGETNQAATRAQMQRLGPDRGPAPR